MRFLLFALGLSVAACSSSTEPEFSLTFRVDRFDRSAGELPEDVAEAGPRQIVVNGGIQTPCLATSGDIRGAVASEGSQIQLQVRWEPSQACQPGVDAFVYAATIRNVPSGTYRLTVSHVFPDQGGYVALDETIVVS